MVVTGRRDGVDGGDGTLGGVITPEMEEGTLREGSKLVVEDGMLYEGPGLEWPPPATGTVRK